MKKSVLNYIKGTIIFIFILQTLPSFAQPEGAVMPDFNLFSIRGEQVSLSAMKNKFVLINFGQTGCPTYAGAQATLMALERKYAGAQLTSADGFEVISISLDTSIAQLNRALAPYGGGLRYEVMVPEMYESGVVKKYGVTRLNTTFFLGPGNRLIGKDLAVNEIESHLQSSAMVEEIFYRVYLGNFPASTEFLRVYDNISHLGQIYKLKNNAQSIAVYLERYSTPQEATYAKEQAIKAGYTEAQVVMFKNNIVVAAAPGEVLAAPPPVKPSEYSNNSVPRNYTPPVNETPQYTQPPAYKNQPVVPLGQEQRVDFVPPQSYLNQNPTWKLQNPSSANQQAAPAQPYYQPQPQTEVTSRDYTPYYQPTPPNTGVTTPPPAAATPPPANATAYQIAELERRLAAVEYRIGQIASELEELLRESRNIRLELSRLRGF